MSNIENVKEAEKERKIDILTLRAISRDGQTYR